MADDRVIEWLLEGDPSIRWQTMRDLLERPEDEWQRDRQRIPEEGWGARFVAALQPDGNWPEGRWTGTLWVLLVLIDLGFPPQHAAVRDAAFAFLESHLTHERAADDRWLMQRMDLCHLGFWLKVGSYFGFDGTRLRKLSEAILRAQFEDGGWNCRIRTVKTTTHSSFHTTFNVLEGLLLAADTGIVDGAAFRDAECRALEFMLAHRMYRSDCTGAVVDERFTYLTFPSHWHYTVLRGLDYIRTCPEITDPRLDDAIGLIESRRKPNGRWPVEKPIAGTTLFQMEKMGGDSRWNTLRALRVLAARKRAVSSPI